MGCRLSVQKGQFSKHPSLIGRLFCCARLKIPNRWLGLSYLSLTSPNFVRDYEQGRPGWHTSGSRGRGLFPVSLTRFALSPKQSDDTRRETKRDKECFSWTCAHRSPSWTQGFLEMKI